ncbi:hybrid sensor histidine kinase/response regulator [Labrys sp. La1]|uniref:ATP-binding response regulator n=1 Tax=Labrys sp. La1 TaxID=3404917 RepID=UPI003EB9A328
MAVPWFKPVPARIAAEQLRFMLGTAPFAFIIGGIGNAAMAVIFALDAPVLPLAIWAVCAFLPVPFLRLLASRFRDSPDPVAEVGRYQRYTIILATAIGVLRGILPWIAFDQASPLAIALLICFMAGIQAGSLTFMAPVLPAFVGYSVVFIALLALKLITLGDPMYWGMAIGSILFCIAIIASARSASQTFQKMVELRFDNNELVERLRQETAVAQAARLEAETANQAKSKFLAAASHDLRQPIHAQGLFLEVLARGQLTAQQREILDNARAASSASGDMLNTLLDFSRLEAGVVTVSKRCFELQPLLNRIGTELAPSADEKGIVYRQRDTDVVVESDPALVELILRNLISNAIRYTDRGGVLIGCRRRFDQVHVEVWDSGIGIAADNQQEIFREFHQLGNPERDRRKGLGLGLAITERLARAANHELRLRSVVGRGSKFALVLPLATGQPGMPADPAPSESLAEHTALGAPCRILVIDDDEAVREGMLRLLTTWGAQCEAVEGIEEARLCLGRLTPDLVICDYRLREQRTGAEAIAILREQIPGLPAILITGDTAPERLREAEASGIPLLHKPVLPAALFTKIRTTMSLGAKRAHG